MKNNGLTLGVLGGMGPAATAEFQRLLARCGTGQETTVYTSHFRGPRPGSEMHIVLVDNGRSAILGNAEHWQTLRKRLLRTIISA